MRRAAVWTAVVFALLAPSVPSAAAEGLPPEGPFRTAERTYDLGRETLRLESLGVQLHRFPTRLAGELTVPLGAKGRRPVVVFLHGAHQSCELADAFFPTQDWPCRPSFLDVESFTGYRYVARILASWGFVVLSIDGNPVAPADAGVLTFPDGAPLTPLTFMDMRAKIVDAQLRRLDRSNRGEQGEDVDFGRRLGHRLDLAHVGLVGHSRGGEGVVWAALLPGPHPYRVRAIAALAPVDFFRRVLPDVPYALILPACDGDVFDLQGGYFYDDARDLTRVSPLWQAVVLGGNHNFFNSVWEDETAFFPLGRDASVDPCSPDQIGKTRLSRPAQEGVAASVLVPFMRVFAGGARAGLLGRLGFGGPMPRTIAGADVDVSFQPPTVRRLDVIRPERASDLRTNLLGGAQHASGVSAYGLCRYDTGSIFEEGEVRGCGPDPALQAHALAELRVAWNRRGGRVVTAVPSRFGDVRAYRALSIRAVPDPSDRRRNPPRLSRPFSLALRDASGNVATVSVSHKQPAVRYPVRIAVLGTVRIPLAAFRGVDLSRIAAIEIRFDRTRKGRLLLTDLSFVR
jgi:hypothetical protein